MEIYFTDAKGLIKAGIDVKKQLSIERVDKWPKAYGGFCKLPNKKN